MSEIVFAPISHDRVTFERESVLRALCSKLPLVLERSVSDQVSWCSGQIEVLRVTSSPESSAKIAKRKLSVVLVLSAASPLSAESVSPDFFIVGASSSSMTKELRRALSHASATHPCYMLTVSLISHGAPECKIAQAISCLRANLRSDVTMESLAAKVYMAVPTFYKHFKQATSLSPLQYLKRLRLYEARRLMLTESLTAAAASYEVGYMSEQHFSRDYNKLFGRPPLQDIKPIFAAHL